MNLAGFSIKRPVTMLMIVAIVLVLGFISLSKLGIDLYPNFTFPGAVVITEYSGASSHEIESIITEPLEQMLSTISNVKKIQSFSSEGNSTIVVEFNWGTDMDAAALDMREKVDFIKPFLPDGVKNPMVIKFDPSMMPVMQLSVYGGNNIVQLKKIVDDTIVNRLLRIEGVASVSVLGGLERQVSIEVDPDKLSFYGLSMQQISGKLKMENLNLPGGNVNQGKKEYILRTEAEFKDVSEIENLPIPLPQGGTVPLRNIAKVNDGFKDVSTISRYDGKPSIGLMIQKQSNYNTVQVAERVKKEMVKLKREIPVAIEYESVLDQADFINVAIGNVKNNAIVGGILAVLVLYLFLKNLSSTLIIALSIPTSIITTFVMVYFNGLTLNIMSLGGLALGVGMLVDNSIVVLENIFRHYQDGEEPEIAAVIGTNEVGQAVTASTLTTVAVFLPIVFVQGITAQFFKELALTVTFSLLSSLIVSLTIVPLLSAKLLSARGINGNTKGKGKKNLRMLSFAKFAIEVFSNFYKKTEILYEKLLNWSLSHRKLVVITSIALFVISILLIPLVGAEFLPQSDAGSINIFVELPYGTNLSQTDKFVTELVGKIREIPEIQGIMENIGSSGEMLSTSGANSNQASIVAQLTSLEKRKRSAQEVAEAIRNLAAGMPGAQVKVRAVSSMDFGGGGALKPISIEIKGDDLEKLKEISRDIVKIVNATSGAREVESSHEKGRPELVVKVNREKATLYGLSSTDIAQLVNSAVSGSVATKYKVGGDEIDVIIRSDESLIDSIYKVRDLLIPSPSGALITLGDVARVEKESGPITINRDNQTRVVMVSGEVLGRATGTVNKEIQEQLKDIALPEGYTIDMGGEQQEMVEAFRDLFLALILAVFLVYMVMAAQFESLKQPFIIMFTVPLSLIGVVLALLGTGRHLSIVSFIGIIMLAGIVVNNAIVLVDFINQLRENGVARNDAIIKAGPMRLRPILMTTLTTVLGLIPMALGIGEGGELRAPMATAVIGGLTFSTLLTLVVIPVIYTIFEDFGDILERYRAKRRKRTAKAEGNI